MFEKKLVKEYLYEALKICNKYCHDSRWPACEYYHAAYFGLLDAVRLFDPTKSKFKTFLYHKVRGKILDAAMEDEVCSRKRSSRAKIRIYHFEGYCPISDKYLGREDKSLARIDNADMVKYFKERMTSKEWELVEAKTDGGWPKLAKEWDLSSNAICWHWARLRDKIRRLAKSA